MSHRFEVYFTLAEVATRLSKGMDWARDRAKAGELGEVFHIGRDWHVTESGLVAFLARHRVDLAAAPTEERRAALLERFQRGVLPGPRLFQPGIKARTRGELARKAAGFSPEQAPGRAIEAEVAHD